MKKHFDNKKDLIKEMKHQKYMNDNAIASTFTVYMMVACIVLFEDFGFRGKRITKFVNGFYKRLDMYHNGQLTMDDLEKNLLEKAGVYVEMPNN